MWQKLKDFTRKDPLNFVLILVLIVVVGGVAGLEMMHATSTAKFCRTCHPVEEVGVRGEYYTWDKNIHSDVDVSCLDCHGEPGIGGYMYAHVVAGTKSLIAEVFKSEEEVRKTLTHYASDPVAAEHASPDESCLFCHTDSYNEKYRKERVISVGAHFREIDGVVNPRYRESYGRPDILTDDVDIGVEPNHKVHLEAGLHCTSCHLGVAHGGDMYNLPEMQTCFDCHDDIRAEEKTVPANEDCAACHTLQDDVQEGKFVESVDEQRWYMADLDCASCHKNAYMRPNTDTCTECHEPYYGDMMIDTQKTFEETLNKVTDVRDSLFREREDMPEGQRALFNEMHRLTRILEKDGSMGVHNPEYLGMIADKALELAEAVKTWTPPVVKEEEEHVIQVEQKEEEPEKPAGPVNTAEKMSIIEGLEEINIAERHVENPTKSEVIFQHKDHAEKLACESCHSDLSGSLKVEIGEVKGMNNAFHNDLCIDCHKEMRVKKTCSTCHK